MRTRTIVKSLDSGQSRFGLCHQAFKAIRKLHSPGDRIQDTTNDALQRLAGANQQSMSVDLKNGNDAAFEVGIEAAIEPLAEALPSELIAAVPSADPSALAGNDRAATIRELWLQNQ